MVDEERRVLESGVGRDSNGEAGIFETDRRGNDRPGGRPDDQPLLAIETLGRGVRVVVIDPYDLIDDRAVEDLRFPGLGERLHPRQPVSLLGLDRDDPDAAVLSP